MMARVVAPLLLCVVAVVSQAEAPPANQAPAPAATDGGYAAAALYNRGNATARAGRHGVAVLNYERARLLAPGDPDLAANLRMVREAAHLAAVPRNWLERSELSLSPTLMAWLGVVGVLLVGSALVWSGRFRNRWLRRGVLALGLLLVGGTLAQALTLWPLLHEAVVLTPATPVRVTPVPMGDPAFVLPEAETVTVSAQHDDFYLIRTRAGKSGWVSRADVAPVVPRAR